MDITHQNITHQNVSHQNVSHQVDETGSTKPVQLQLAGLESVPPGIDPRFILSDEMCRNGLRHIAAIRRRLTGDSQHQAA